MGRQRRSPRSVGLGAFTFWLAACAILGQTTGSIIGRVVDPTGSPLPGVAVEATSERLQGARAATTSSSGAYRFASLPPGSYRVRATLSGFRSVEKGATVSLDATATVDLTLEVSAEEQLVVSGEAPLIDKTATTTGTNYTSNVIAHLPVSRNYADIVKSNPGVSTDRGSTEGRSLALSIYGATSAENQWVIDGVNTTNVLKGVQGKAINNEFVQEVEVKTGGYQAEYGRALGGVVNVITKSGGNQFHGDAFSYYDSTGTAAEQQFQPGDSGIAQMRVADGERFDYGADLGGFILKDRLWFFGAYNRIDFQGGLSRVEASTYVPITARFPFESTENLYSGKLTWNVASSTTVVGTVFADPSSNSGAAGADPRQGLGAFDVTPPVSLDPSTWYSSRAQGGTDYGLRLTQLFGSRAIATLQGSYHRDENALTAPDGIRYVDETCAGGAPDDRCAFPPEPKSIRGGYGLVSGVQDHSVSSRQQYAANVTLYEGNHEIKAGGDYMNGQTDATTYFTGEQVVRLRNEYGQPYYMHRFFAADPDDPRVVPSFQQRAQVLDYGVYLQDSWRAAPGLTVNLGLRWDGESTRNYAGQTVLQFNNEWQPRVGVVWDPWRDGTTKVFAFAGRFSYALPTVAAARSFGDFPGQIQTYNFDPISVIQDPNVLNHEEPVVQAGAGRYGTPVDSGVRASSMDELTVGVERLIVPTLTVGLKGTYRSLNSTLEDRCDFDYNSPETDYSPCAIVNPGSDGKFASGDVPTCNGLYDDPDWYQCYPTGPASPEVKRYYRGLELFARQTVGNSLWLQASYVYSTLRGNYDGGVNQGFYGQTNPGINSDFDYPALWHNGSGTLALDRTNRFRFDGFWVTPLELSVGLQAFVETGAPLNQMGYFNDGYGPYIFLVPRGSVGRLPTLWGTNLTLSYPIAIGPTTVTLQAYLFNVFNKQIAVDRDNSWSSTSPPADFPATIYDPNQEQTNPYYGAITRRQEPRVFRAAIRVSF
jgi:outer membrane receptor protein involved in Fe transport